MKTRLLTFLKNLVSFNVKLCDYLARKFPHLVKEESYKEQLLSFVNKIVKERGFKIY